MIEIIISNQSDNYFLPAHLIILEIHLVSVVVLADHKKVLPVKMLRDIFQLLDNGQMLWAYTFTLSTFYAFLCLAEFT